MEESGVGDDLCLAAEVDMRGSIIDIIHIEVDDMLLEREDCVACFEDLVELSGCEVGEVVDVQFDSAGEKDFFFLFARFGG